MNQGDLNARMRGQSGSQRIIRDDIGDFCEGLTQQYRGWLVGVMNQGEDGQWRVVADEQPLQALSYQEDGKYFDIRVVLGSDYGENFAHVIHDVRSIDFREDGSGAPEDMRIGSASGTTSLRFRSPSR